MLLGIRWGSLRTKIIAWSFIPTIIILVTVAVVIYYAYQDVAEDLVVERNRELALLSANHLTAELESLVDLLDAETRSADISGDDPVARHEGLKGAAYRLAAFDAGVLILDPFGTVVAAEPERPEIMGQNWSDRAYYRQVLRSEIDGVPGPAFSDMVPDGPGGAQVIVTAVPITDEQNRFRGIMAGMLRVGATDSTGFYADLEELGETGSAYLVDGQGKVIYHSDPGTIGADFATQVVVQRVLGSELGAVRTHDLSGQEIVASFAPVPGTEWGLVIEENWAELIDPGQGYRRFLVMLLVLGVVVPTVVVAVGVRRITRPIIDLIAAAQGVAAGSFGRKIAAQTGDEIEELADQFNLMSAQLQESYVYLEQRAADRTRELAALNTIAAVVSQSLDLDQILNSALNKVLEVMDIEAGGIYLVDEEAEMLNLVAQRGFGSKLVAEIDRLRVGEGFSGRVAQSGDPLVVRDVSTDPRLTKTAIRDEEFRSLISVPLSSKRKILGTLFAGSWGYREFTDQDVELLTSIGNQIGMAVESSRLFEAERRRAEQSRVIAEVGRQIASILDIDQVLVLLVRLIQRAFGYDHVGIALVEGDEAIYKVGAGELWDDPDFEFRPARLKVGVEGVTGWVASSGQPILVPDVRQEPRYVWMEGSRTRSELAVPIKARGRVIGVLDAQSERLNAFDQADLTVLQSLAHQAGIAIENARLFDAEQRRAEQFRVISEMGRHMTSILEVDELLHEIVCMIRGTFGYYLVGISLIEGDELVVRAGAGPPFHEPGFVPPRIKVGGQGITGWVAATGEPVLAPDVSQDPRYLFLSDVAKTKSELAVPIKTKTAVIGVLNVESDRLDDFDQSDLAMLQSLANQSAIAIENARLFDAEQRRAEQFRVISEVGRRVTSILTVDDLLLQMATLIKESFGYHHVGIGLIEGDEVVSKAEVGASAAAYESARLKVGKEGVWGWVAHRGEPLLVPDVRQEPRFAFVPEAADIRSQVCVPLKTKEAVIGVLSAESDQLDAFDDSDLTVLQSLAHQAAFAVENVYLYEQAQQLAVMEERQRLARELHDAVTQTLFSASLISEALPALWESDQEEGRQLLRELRQLSRGALAEMRTLLLELRPAALIEARLSDLLHQLGEAVTGRTGVPVTVAVEGECTFPSDVHVALYRIAQEALNNVVKHANADQVTVSLCCTTFFSDIDRKRRQEVELQVSDDGCGFDPSSVPPDRLGLGIIRERAHDIGAMLEIRTEPGRGTWIKVVWKEEE